MNKKVKLTTGLIILGGLGGAGIVAIQNDSGSGPVSTSGGAFFGLSSADSYSSGLDKLKVVKESVNDLSLEIKKQLGDISLSPEDLEELLKILLTSDDISSDKSKGSISTIKKEITREGSVSSIQGSAERNYQLGTRGKNLKQLFSDLQSAFEKIKRWEEKGGLNRQNGKLSDSKEISELTRQERVALKVFFVTYSSLNQRRPQLILQLQKVSSDFKGASNISIDSKQSINQPLSAQVQSALNKIQWDKSKIKIKASPQTPRSSRSISSPQQQNLYGWGAWSQNPYRNFFESPEEFQKAVESIDSSKASLEEYLNSKRFEGLMAMWAGAEMVKHVYRDKEKYINATEEARSSVELQVGKMLMNWMGK